MHINIAKEVARIISEDISSASDFTLLRCIKSGRIKNFHQFANDRKSFGSFLIGNGEKNLWFLLVDWKENDNYYLVIYPENNNLPPIAELHKVSSYGNEHDLYWSYSPSKRDKKNKERKSYFASMFNSCEAVISLPSATLSLDEFLTNAFHLAECRVKSDNLESLDQPLEPTAFSEGKRLEKKHKARERSSKLVNLAKKKHAEKNNGNLPCEVCGFDFHKAYGEKGHFFIEAHHKVPLSELDDLGTENAVIEDLALVCANCHRMLHRGTGSTIETLKSELMAV